MLTKEKIKEVIQDRKPELTRLGVKNIGLFGSYVKGSANRESDIDLLVDFVPERETFDNLMAVYDVLEKAFSKNKITFVQNMFE